MNETLPLPLTQIQIAELLPKATNHAVKNLLIEHNLRMVINGMSRYKKNTQYEFEDLISIGVIGHYVFKLPEIS